MTMPTWDQTLFPIMKELAGGEVRTAKELREKVIDVFHMSVDEQGETLKSGQLRISNRVGWGLTHLHKAKLIENAEKRGSYRITEDGKAFLNTHCDGFAREQLEAVPAFIAWKKGYQDKNDEVKSSPVFNHEDVSTATSDDQTPEDLMEKASEQLNETLASELLDRIMANDPYFFERLVTKLVLGLGYGDLSQTSGEVTKKSGDGGIDGVVRLDRLGLDSVYIQAKRWNSDHVVGRPDIQGFVGALVENGAQRGVFITTSRFSEEARRYAEVSMRSSNLSVVLIDGMTLTKLMIEYNVGVSVKTSYEVKAVDNDFFDNE
ncbi:restriction endonuclease [Bifidobacterium olomucense]|uniref:Restriction endonuclease n=1 Tax=Bifidobacterium olomucense TaxID=2675324 RepID=A0A7Y0HVF3_9BIFI|nr:restriction endonuclease [Bifidobacterium sp. DSM 109959]NMM98220.1 restriction endonuclease [Bifidobacterium sp. DSM 109959]